MKVASSLLATVATLLMTTSPSSTLASPISDAEVIRTAPDQLVIEWKDPDPVDVLMADSPDTAAAAATLLSARDGDGSHAVRVEGEVRPYFLLRDSRGGEVRRVAERVLPLEQGSNFRDVGGYAAADGKHVRWGLIYRSGGQPLLSDADVARVKSLGIANLVDLRSNEERVLAPSRLDGIPYNAIGYSMAALTGPPTDKPKDHDPALDPEAYAEAYANSYRAFPTLVAPHLRIIFGELLSKEQPILYNCSAGQDRTGFVTAVVLSALGVPRDTIYPDYLLSTPLRNPQWELPPISDALAQSDPIAALFASAQKRPEYNTPNSLLTPTGEPFLTVAFEEIEKRWGSVDAYLKKEIGLSEADIAALRLRYLE